MTIFCTRDSACFKLGGNVLKTGPVIEPEKLPVHDSLVGTVVEPRLNR